VKQAMQQAALPIDQNAKMPKCQNAKLLIDKMTWHPKGMGMGALKCTLKVQISGHLN
jgi:hypothetical protein